MSLDKYIKISLISLSNNYDISLIEITKCFDGCIKKSYTINYKKKNTDELNIQKFFCNKRDLVSWLVCLK